MEKWLSRDSCLYDVRRTDCGSKGSTSKVEGLQSRNDEEEGGGEMKYFCGVDPGKRGAIVLINEKRVVVEARDMPTTDAQLFLFLEASKPISALPFCRPNSKL